MDYHRNLNIEILHAQLVYHKSYCLFSKRLIVEVISGDASYMTKTIRINKGLFVWNEQFHLPKVGRDELTMVRILDKSIWGIRCVAEASFQVSEDGKISNMVYGALPMIGPKSGTNKGSLVLKAEWESSQLVDSGGLELTKESKVIEMGKAFQEITKKYENKVINNEKNLTSPSSNLSSKESKSPFLSN